MRTVLKVLLGLILVFVLAIAAFAVVVSMQPEEARYTRSAVMNVTADKPFAQVNDFKKWNDWSPWAKMDPNMKVTYSGPPTGAGSSYAWVGNDQVGEGRMTITESYPTNNIKINLDFIAPFAANNVTEFTFAPDGERTNVTWTMSGKNNFVMKAFCLVVDMDKMIGADFERGLASMKAIVESQQAPQ